MKKSWIPIALLIAFVFAYNQFVIQPYSKKYQKPVVTAPIEPTAKSPTPTPGTPVTTTTAANAPGASAGADYAPPPLDSRAALFSADQLLKREAFVLDANRSLLIHPDGSLGGAIFKDYVERENNEKRPVELLTQGFRLASTDPAVAHCLATMAQTEKSEGRVVYAAQTPRGTCQITYVFDRTKVGLVSGALDLNGFAGAAGFVEVKGLSDLGKGASQDHNYLAFRITGDEEKIRDKKLFESQDYRGPVDWLVWGDRYFVSALLPKGKFNPDIFHRQGAVETHAAFGFRYPLLAEGGTQQHIEFDTYFGTRDADVLSLIKPGLEQSVDLGWFRAVSQLMLWCLKGINRFVGNYGVAIIVLTLFVRMVFWPLNKRVFSSSLKMKAIQPEIEAMKKRYEGKKTRDSQQAMNMEMLGLYKKHGVNPMGSCLPLLLQMPIFIGLYGALNHSMDLYQAPFFGWIHDLSSKDPFYVFPTLWTMSLLAYVQLNPTPQQTQPGMPDMKWIMIAMNLFFGYLSKDWPAGLTLYLFVSNLVGISQQLVMRRQAAKLQPIQEGA